MKFIIFFAFIFFSSLTHADESPICLTKNSAQLFLNGDKIIYRIRVNENEVEILNAFDSEVVWRFRSNGQVLKREDSQILCKRLVEDFMKARVAAAMEGLKSNSSLALALLLPIGLTPVSTQDCDNLDGQRIYDVVPTHVRNSSPLGGRIGVSVVDSKIVVMEHLRGLVYQNQGCRRIGLHK